MNSDDKVLAIFRELVGDRADRLKGSKSLSDSIDRIASGLHKGNIQKNQDIGFHLMDWQAEAAFLVAVALYPERFTDEEIQDGVEGVLIHAPHHIIEAARQGGYGTQNIFDEKNGGQPSSRANDHSCHGLCSEQHTPRQP